MIRCLLGLHDWYAAAIGPWGDACQLQVRQGCTRCDARRYR